MKTFNSLVEELDEMENILEGEKPDFLKKKSEKSDDDDDDDE